MAEETKGFVSTAAMKDTSIKDKVLANLYTEYEKIKKSYSEKDFAVDINNPALLARALYLSRGIASKYYDLQAELLKYIAKAELRYRLFKLEAMDTMSVEKSKEYPLNSDFENTKNLHYAKAILSMVEVQLTQMEGWNATFSRLQTVLLDSSKQGLINIE